MKFLLYIILFFFIFGCTYEAQDFEIKLETVVDDAESVEEYHGMSNIFFEPASKKFNYSPEWGNPEIAILSEPEGYEPVHVIRYENSDGETEYVVDTNSDLDFTNESKLSFVERDDRSVADVIIHLKSKNYGTTFPVNFQLVKIQDWRYGRISEFRTGKLSIGEEEYDIKLFPRARNHPIYESSPWLNTFIDLNQDGRFSERWQLADDQSLLKSERIDITQPFKINRQAYQMVAIDSLGQLMTIAKSKIERAPVEGFKIPDFKTKTIDGKEQNFLSYIDKPTILEFWSTTCPFSEMTRPDINRIHETHHEAFNLISTPRENNLDEIEKHISEHPKQGTLLVHNEIAWQELNPLPVSPLYYLVDSNGRILMKSQGANSIKPLEEKLNQLIAQTK